MRGSEHAFDRRKHLKVGLLKLTQFGERSFEEFQKELLELESQGMEGLIVDLSESSLCGLESDRTPPSRQAEVRAP